MTDIALYRNISTKNKVYNKLYVLGKQLQPSSPLSVSKTLEVIVNEKFSKLGLKELSKDPERRPIKKKRKNGNGR